MSKPDTPWDPLALRAWLEERLPSYMIPAHIIPLLALPLSPNGKLDRRALPAPIPGPDATVAYVAPQTPAEALLAQLWAEVLRVERISRQDNFFALGGDSILSLQVIARARQVGLLLSPKQFFQAQTVAALAAMANQAQDIAIPQGPVMGPVPLIPIQHWFFAQTLPNPHHWNQAVLLTVPANLDRAAVEVAVQALLDHHDALRMQFIPDEAGWRQVNRPPAPTAVVHWEDFATVSEAAQAVAIEAAAAAWQTRLHLTEGPMLRLVIFTLGPERPGRLLLVFHHLVVDGVSWRILLDDLLLAYQQATQGQPPQLPAKTASFQQWATGLQSYATSPTVQQDATYWLTPAYTQAASLPVDDPDAPRTEATLTTVNVILSAADTDTLLHELPAAAHVHVPEVLLTALALTLVRWLSGDHVLIDLEGHGRDDLGMDLDVSRTVGWFTTLYPVLLTVAADSSPGVAFNAIKAQLRRLPPQGLSYGLLRYLGADATVAAQLQALPAAAICFNYLGQLDQAIATDAPWAPAPEAIGSAHAPQNPLSHEWDITAQVAAGRLEVTWGYSQARYRSSTMQAVSQQFLATLQTLIAYGRSPEAGNFSPADFPDIEIEQQTLDAILERLG